MIVVRVELWSARTGEKSELARMVICNEGGSRSRGDYAGKTFFGRDSVTLNNSLATDRSVRDGHVKGHRRLQLHVWHLVAKMLAAMDYGAE